MPAYATVILPLHLNQTYTYIIPEKLQTDVFPGIRVVVQFARRKIYSVLVINTHDEKPEGYELKEILSVLDKKPIINPQQIKFWKWIASYYMCTLGEVFKAALPAGFKLESETHVLFNPLFTKYEDLTEQEIILHKILEDRQTLSINEINAIADFKNVLAVINSMLGKGAVKVEEKLQDRYKPKMEVYVQLHDSITDENELKKTFDLLEKAPKQLEILMKYLQMVNFQLKERKDVLRKELLGFSKNYSILNSLVDKGVFQLLQKQVDRLPAMNGPNSKFKKLNESQQNAIEKINTYFKQDKVVLLHGVTSSGKTEVYIHLIKNTIQQGKQVLYLLPEIALTTQIITRLKDVFGDIVGIYHSKFSDSERIEVWNKLLDEQHEDSYKIILGVRSSVFLPFKNLGLVIVDEEHENTYKQFDPAPRYNARDAAIYLANLYNAKTILGTATPSFDVFYNTSLNKYKRVGIDLRFLDIELPEIIISDTKRALKKKQMKSHFTETLLEHISDALNKKEQVILFQNRRGFAPFIECISCGWIPKCKQCDVSLTYHKHFNNLSCHYCGYTINMVSQCKECGSTEVYTRGFGTEKIEDEIAIFFPKAKIARLDLDTTRKKQAYFNIISKFEEGSIDILIGTQMVSKGLDFDNVSLVGILNADNMLFYPDFRAFERSFQLMAQVSGRAGRKKGRGKVIIQTSTPDHPVIKYVVKNDYNTLYNWQIKERERFSYPPFTRLIKISIKNKDRNDVNRNANLLANELRRSFGKRILGPEYPVISKVQNWHIKNILIKIERDKSLQKAKEIINSITENLKKDELFRKAVLVFDVDPL